MYEADKRITKAIKGGCLLEIFYGFFIIGALITLISLILLWFGVITPVQQ
jgi:tetrahydromethanopterin S-methyltransferase subunit B